MIAVPTGIVSVEMAQTNDGTNCSECDHIETDKDSKYCRKCGNQLNQ